ncbi:MAG: recombinase family protein [Bacillota bacterium]
MREGKWPDGPPPLGYRVGEDGRLEVEPREAEIVTRIFHLYTGGMASAPIADLLNAEGVPVTAHFKGTQRNTEQAWRWRASGVIQILRDPVYIGQYQYHRGTGEVLTIGVTAIVKEEVWRKAEQLRARNKKETTRNAEQT